ncbi:MAG: DUF3037 domain-containing protein, partial [Verrucomicrobiales bacterium]|nr:DUF3037 domain-containing protein [Verrucomicrobiales bacterium]
MNLVINFAAVGFRPYRELGEFVNVGIIAVEAKSRYLTYRLISPQKTKRISACFPELDLTIYKNGIRRLENELSTLSIETNLWADDAKQAGKNHPAQADLFVELGDMDLFRQLTATQASTFFYGARGTRLTDDVDQCLDELYKRYVEHWNLTPIDYEEKKLIRDLKKLLQANRLDRLYREAPWVGTDVYHVGVPLAFTPRGAELPEKAIKPLNLAQSTPTRVYTRGDEWISKIRRLQRINSLPEEFLFVVKKPEDQECLEAANEICDGLEQLGAQVASFEDEKAILEFARI